MVHKYTDTSINGAEGLADNYGMAMLIVGSVLANNDIFSDEAVKKYSADNMKYYVDQCFRRGAGPQVFYHLCGNHETDYKVFKDTLMWSPFTVIHVGYDGKEGVPVRQAEGEFEDRATCMGSVDTKLMINPNPMDGLQPGQGAAAGGRDSKKGYILGTSCERPRTPYQATCMALVKAARDFGTYGTW